jgi:hypothetical protein
MYTSLLQIYVKENERARTVTLIKKETNARLKFIKDGGLSSNFLIGIDITPVWIKLKECL